MVMATLFDDKKCIWIKMKNMTNEHVSDEFKMLRQNWDMTQAIHTNMSFDKKFEVVRCIPIT